MASQGPLQPSVQPNLVVNMVTEQAVAESAPVAQLAAKLLAADGDQVINGAVTKWLTSNLTVTVPLQSNLLQITWQAQRPDVARQGQTLSGTRTSPTAAVCCPAQISKLATTLNGQVASLHRQIKAVQTSLGGTNSGGQRQDLEDNLSAALNNAADQDQ